MDAASPFHSSFVSTSFAEMETLHVVSRKTDYSSETYWPQSASYNPPTDNYPYNTYQAEPPFHPHMDFKGTNVYDPIMSEANSFPAPNHGRGANYEADEQLSGLMSIYLIDGVSQQPQTLFDQFGAAEMRENFAETSEGHPASVDSGFEDSESMDYLPSGPDFFDLEKPAVVVTEYTEFVPFPAADVASPPSESVFADSDDFSWTSSPPSLPSRSGTSSPFGGSESSYQPSPPMTPSPGSRKSPRGPKRRSTCSGVALEKVPTVNRGVGRPKMALDEEARKLRKNKIAQLSRLRCAKEEAAREAQTSKQIEILEALIFKLNKEKRAKLEEYGSCSKCFRKSCFCRRTR